MFIVVNYNIDFGLEEYGRFDTKVEAFKYIADAVKFRHGFEIDMSDYPFDDTKEIDFNDMYISFGDNWCVCVGTQYTDRWLILEA
jgi:hypothetical protein